MRSTVVLLVLLLAPADVRANHVPAPPPDTIAVLTDASRPVLALDPSTGDQHVAYVSDGTLYHAWASGGGWLSEPIASSVILMQTTHQYGGFDLRVAPDGRVYALYRRSSDLEFAERVSGVWQPHVLDAVPAQVHHVSLAASPVTSEPVVAWTKAGAHGFTRRDQVRSSLGRFVGGPGGGHRVARQWQAISEPRRGLRRPPTHRVGPAARG